MPFVPNTFRRLIAIILIAAGIGWSAYELIGRWLYQSEFTRSNQEMDAGQFNAARDLLARLHSRWPDVAEVALSLGVCEAALGHVEPALAAWERIPRSTELGVQATLNSARLAIEHGRLALAEEKIEALRNTTGTTGEEVYKLGLKLDLFSGRGNRIPQRIEKRWKATRERAKELRTHWLFDTQPFPIDSVRVELEKLGREAPDDDRIWLGKADLATRSGHYDEADSWLTRCEHRRPDDPDVWRARLAWALEASLPDRALDALKHIPASDYSTAIATTITARLAALRNDTIAERDALRSKVSLDPGDAASWARLADIETADRKAQARDRKAEIDRARDRYRILMGEVAGNDLTHVVELAQLAEALGRHFEARGWWTIRVVQTPDDQAGRKSFDRLERILASEQTPQSANERSLAEMIKLPFAVSTSSEPSVSQAVRVVPTFEDLAERSGLIFTYDNDQTPLRRLPETMGGGLGLIDYDNDGFMDVYAIQGGKFPPRPDETAPNGDRLFRNNRDGTFEDVSIATKIAGFKRGFGHGVAVCDYDNDGHSDLFITRWRTYSLYRNKGDGTFEDVTDRVGLGGQRGWPTSAAFADIDNDGDLDLYVCQYLRWDPELSPPCSDPERPGQNLYCVPRGFEAEPDRLFRNDHGRFVDISTEAGIVDKDGRGLGVVIADLDGDSKPDIYVANDMTANFFFHNIGGCKFEEIGISSGSGSNAEGGFQAGMGIACGDLDGDGLPDLAVTNFYGESTTFFQNLGRGMFADRSAAIGLAAPTRYLLGFGTYFLDANNDGLLDLATVNGHVNDYRPATAYAMPAQLLLGVGKGKLVDISARAGECWSKPRVGRGLAVGDLDNDGLLDLIILSQAGPLSYLHNTSAQQTTTSRSRWLTLRLEGKTSNRDAVGALVLLKSSGKTQLAERIAGGSFLSACDGRIHFGLGEVAKTELIEAQVRWPGGITDRYLGLKPDTAYHLLEGDSHAKPLGGWKE